MGKSLIQQARGRGSLTYRVRRAAFKYFISYPPFNVEGKAIVQKIINSAAHSAPLARLRIENHSFIIPAPNGMYEGQEIWVGARPDKKIEQGDIIQVKDIPQGTRVFNVEKTPGKGGKYLRTAGNYAVVVNKDNGRVELLVKRRTLRVHERARATIGTASGDGRKIKPVVKAGKRFYMMRAIGRKWHRSSAVKMNAVDHPFGGGRGKRIKSKIAKRNAPAGARVGHIRPSRTGRKK